MSAPHVERCEHGVPAYICRSCSPEEILSVTDDEPWYGVLRPVEDDGLAPARGCVVASLVGMALWIAIFGGLAIAIAWAVRR